MTQLPDEPGVQLQRDGTKIFKKDGYQFTVRPDGTRIVHHKTGDKMIFKPDGTIVAIYACGTKVTKMPDGTRVQEFRDGSEVTLFSPRGDTGKVRRRSRRAYRQDDFVKDQALIKSSEFVLGPNNKPIPRAT